jgi:NAD-dependent SIR2 family protein deacetylase
MEIIETAKLHKAASFHRFEIFHSEYCSCFSCGKSFTPQQIVEWTDKDMTALCPYCKMDAVLPSYNDTPTDDATLEALNQYSF